MSRRQRRAEMSRNGGSAFVTLFNDALAKQQAGDYAGAEAGYRKAATLNPNVALLYNNLGVALHSQRKNEEAVAVQKKAIALDPSMAMAYNNMGVAYNALGRHAEAIPAFEKAIALVPNNPEAINNLGDSYVKLSRFEEGEKYLRQSLALQPDYIEALTNLGAAKWGQGQLDEAIAQFRKVIAMQPDLAMPHKNLGIVSLLKGNYEEGWREYDWRWLADNIRIRAHSKPIWRGENVGEQKVLIWAEQGVGDEILHASMLGDFVARGINVMWECDPRLVALFQRSYPTVHVVARRNPPDPVIEDVAANVPSGTIGNFVRRSAAEFPTRARYLESDPVRKAAFRSRLGLAPGEKLVGMSWLSKNLHFGASKSTALSQWSEILRTPGLRFVDLQYGDTAAERASFKAAGGELIHLDDLDLREDLDGLAALVDACDFVVTVSNTTAHVAAALGKPTLILIASGIGKFWYWGFEGEKTLWYPSATLIRQELGEDWSRVLGVVKDRVAALAQA